MHTVSARPASSPERRQSAGAAGRIRANDARCTSQGFVPSDRVSGERLQVRAVSAPRLIRKAKPFLRRFDISRTLF